MKNKISLNEIKRLVRQVLDEQMLLEGASDIMYHFTQAKHAVSILTDNYFKLSVGDKRDKELNQGKDFYLSTTRTKILGFNGAPVKLVLDGRRLKMRYRIAPVKYFEGEITEQEDRIIFDKQFIPNAKQYILSVHMVLNDSLGSLVEICKKNDIPFFVYRYYEDFLVQKNALDEEQIGFYMGDKIDLGSMNITDVQDGLDLEWLSNSNEWKWFFNPNNKYKNVSLGWNPVGDKLIWYDGTWIKGIWEKGIWKGGTFEGKIWRYGEFWGGTFASGTWKGGWFLGGTFAGGTWDYGEFYGGTFAGKTWKDGGFHGGTFAGETWENGGFHGGTFASGAWEGGKFFGGTFASGTWKGGYWKDGTWENGTWIKGKIWDEELDDYVESDVNPNEYYKNKEQ